MPYRRAPHLRRTLNPILMCETLDFKDQQKFSLKVVNKDLYRERASKLSKTRPGEKNVVAGGKPAI